jgi:hypothetical protein
MESNPVQVTSITKADSKHSDGDVVAFTNSTCVVIDTDNPPDCVDGKDPRLVTATTDVFAADRRTALAVNKSKYLPAGAVDHSGLVNKWPFDSEKKTYPYWEGTLGKAVPARYDRTVYVRGMKTYVYKVETKGAQIDVAEGVPGTYDDVKEIYVEPRTGAIVNQTESQQRALADGTQVLDLKIGFTDPQIKTSVDEVKGKLGTITLILTVVPLVGIIGGALLFIVAILLLLSGRRRTAYWRDETIPA